MKRLVEAGNWVVLAAALGLLAGCATSTVATRKQEHYAAYSELTPEMRSLVDQGRIAVGMSMDGVYIAWGKPEQISEGESSAGKTTTWTYHGSYLQDVDTLGWRRVYHTTYVQDYIRAQAIFTNGAVKEWQTYPAPGF